VRELIKRKNESGDWVLSKLLSPEPMRKGQAPQSERTPILRYLGLKGHEMYGSFPPTG